MKRSGWHKGSRFWGMGYPTVLLSAALTVYLRDPLPFVTVAPLFFALAGAHNIQQLRNPDERSSEGENA